MTREEAIAVLEAIRQYIIAHYLCTLTEEDNEAIDMAISALSVIEQTKWERDTALATLEEHGIGLGEVATENSCTEPKGCHNCGTPTDKCFYCIEEDRMWTPKQTEPSDLISREEAMNTVWNEAKEYEKEFMVSEDSEDYSHDVGYLSGMHRAKLILKLMPSVSAERVGVWEQCENKGIYQCSYCHKLSCCDSDYCSNCGARMENKE